MIILYCYKLYVFCIVNLKNLNLKVLFILKMLFGKGLVEFYSNCGIVFMLGKFIYFVEM